MKNVCIEWNIISSSMSVSDHEENQIKSWASQLETGLIFQHKLPRMLVGTRPLFPPRSIQGLDFVIFLCSSQFQQRHKSVGDKKTSKNCYLPQNQDFPIIQFSPILFRTFDSKVIFQCVPVLIPPSPKVVPPWDVVTLLCSVQLVTFFP